MSLSYKKENITYAKAMRKSMTDEERKLWLFCLKDLPFKFRRQRAIGNYIVDFYSSKLKLVIELDGSQHYSEEVKAYDEKRDEYLESFGIRVVRIANNEVRENFNAVRQYVYNLCNGVE